MKIDLLRGSVNAVVIKIENRCVKMKLPNGNTVDILTEVFQEISKWIQSGFEDPESGGYIVGYQHKYTNNVSLERVSHPYPLDTKTRVHFSMKDPRHKLFLLRTKLKKSYYMGVWHTHPQSIPIPSDIDWKDWHETIKMDKTAGDYVFFLIAGTDCARLWVGDFKSKNIVEIFECGKKGNLYIKQ